MEKKGNTLDEIKKIYPEKFVAENKIFRHLHRGDRTFIEIACGESQFLVFAHIMYVKSHPKAFFDIKVYGNGFLSEKGLN